jgi:hypothetical protein
MGSCEHGNEPSGSIKGGEFLDYLSDYYILKMVYAPMELITGPGPRRFEIFRNKNIFTVRVC